MSRDSRDRRRERTSDESRSSTAGSFEEELGEFVSNIIETLAIVVAKILAVVAFPSLYIYRRRETDWRRLTAGYWPALYLLYPVVIVGVLWTLYPSVVEGIERRDVRIIFGVTAVSGLLAVVVVVDRLPVGRIPGRGVFDRTGDDEFEIPVDEIYRSSDGAGDVVRLSLMHILLLGQTGRGKSSAMKILLDQIPIEEIVGFCYDYDGEYQEIFEEWGIEYTVIGPGEYEVIPDLLAGLDPETDLGLLARSLVAAKDVDGGDFEGGARTVIEGGLRLIHQQRREADHHVGNAAIARFFGRDPQPIYEDLVDAGLEQYGAPLRDAEAGQSPHHSVVTQAVTNGLRGSFEEDGSFSIPAFAGESGGIVVFDPGHSDTDAVGGAFRLLLDLSIREAMKYDEIQTYFFLDEFDTLPGSSWFTELLARGRSHECTAIAGVQSVSQMELNFGEKSAWSVINNFTQSIGFAPGPDDATFKAVMNQIREERRTEVGESRSVSRGSSMERGTRTQGSSERIADRTKIPSAEIAEMGKGDALIKEDGGEWWFAKIAEPERALERLR